MALTTRCPQCGTTFKLVADQLRIRNGLVRCGVCASVFDGREYLDEALDPQATYASSTTSGRYTQPNVESGARGRIPAAAPVAAPAAAPLVTPAAAPVAAPAAAPVVTPAATPVVAPAAAPFVSSGSTSVDAAVSRYAPDAWSEPEAPVQRSAAAAPDVLRTRASAPFRAERDEPVWRADGYAPVSSEHAYDSRAHEEPAANRPGDAHDDEDDVRQPYQAAAARDRFYGERKTTNGPREPGLHKPLDDESAVRGEPRTRYVDDYHSGRTPPSFMDEGAQAHQAQRSRLWGVGCLILAVVLLGLLLHTYRNQVAASFPTLRPALEAACRPLGCSISYERRIERISIMSSSLRAPPGGASAAADTHELVLTVVMRNRYNAPQPWPALSLELKDLADRVVVRKVLYPKDYLPGEVASQPFGANAERRLAVPISVRNVQVNGYQIDKFFP